MKKLIPLTFILFTGCTIMFANPAPQAPPVSEANIGCVMRCQETHGLCMSGAGGGGGASRVSLYNQCTDVLQDCYDLCRQEANRSQP